MCVCVCVCVCVYDKVSGFVQVYTGVCVGGDSQGITHLQDIAGEVRVLVGPVRASDGSDDLHQLVADKPWHGAVLDQEVRGQELPKLHPLGGVNRQPLVRH